MIIAMLCGISNGIPTGGKFVGGLTGNETVVSFPRILTQLKPVACLVKKLLCVFCSVYKHVKLDNKYLRCALIRVKIH